MKVDVCPLNSLNATNLTNEKKNDNNFITFVESLIVFFFTFILDSFYSKKKVLANDFFVTEKFKSDKIVIS